MTDVKQMLAVGAAVLSMLGFAASAAAEVPGTMTYTGTLNKDGKPYDGQVTAEFALYDSETGGQQVWSETIDSLPVQDGRFVAQLGSKNSLDGVFDGKELWLQVTVEGTKLKPRNHIGATPYAHRAAVADRAKEADRASNAEKLGGTKASEVTDVEASEVSYDNASSGLKATDAQAAIDEVAKLRKQVKSLKTSLEQVKQKYAKKSYVDGNFTKTSKLKSTYARKATVKKKAGQSELTFVKTQFSKLKGRVQSVESDVASNKSAISKLKADKADKTVVSKIRRRTQDMRRAKIDGQPSVLFEGVNVHVRNGSGSTSTTNGKGNVVIGYNENNSDKRKGSHNLVVGDRHSYTKASYAGIVAGKNNRIAAKYASVTGGRENRAETPYSAVLGGRQNRVVDEKPNKNGNGKDGAYGVVAAGFNNRAWGDYSSVSGGGCAKQWGRCNAAKEKFSTVVGGTRTEVPPSPRSSWGKKEQHLWGHYGGRQEDFFLIRSGNGEQCYDLDWRHRCKNP